MSNLELNPNKEYILAGDISGSMNERDVLCNDNTRYKYMLEQFKSFIKIAEDFDEHGAPTVMLFGNDVLTFEHVTLDDVDGKLSRVIPNGMTNMHLLLDEAYQLHCDEKIEMKSEGKVHPGTQLLIFTDGEPTNRAAVERSLIHIVKNIDDENEFQIHLITVGTISRNMQVWLDNLHDEMDNPTFNPNDFDIIHISRLEDTTFMAAVGASRHEDKVA